MVLYDNIFAARNKNSNERLQKLLFFIESFGRQLLSPIALDFWHMSFNRSGHPGECSLTSSMQSIRHLLSQSLFPPLPHASIAVMQNKRRMRRRGRWQPTKRFLPVLVCNWTYGLVSGNRGAEVHNKKALPRSSSYSRKIGAPCTTHSEAHGKRVALCPAAVC